MTFLAVLFAAGPVLGAAACAAEGCSLACLQETAAVSASADDGAGAGADFGGCADDACMCAVGHCTQVASIPVAIEAAGILLAADVAPPVAAEQIVSAAPQGLERPPRA
ncbi:MAG TPA: hypothetical protein VGO52_18920 [Hyphomonadaceae bacterium]|nr:hypothetical protein [Hyphomonadaceae bacterium]